MDERELQEIEEAWKRATHNIEAAPHPYDPQYRRWRTFPAQHREEVTSTGSTENPSHFVAHYTGVNAGYDATFDARAREYVWNLLCEVKRLKHELAQPAKRRGLFGRARR